MMTLIELQEHMGKVVEAINDEYMDPYDAELIFRRANATVGIAKQMIHNADVIFKTNKLYEDGEFVNSNIMGLVSKDYVEEKKE